MDRREGRGKKSHKEKRGGRIVDQRSERIEAKNVGKKDSNEKKVK